MILYIAIAVILLLIFVYYYYSSSSTKSFICAPQTPGSTTDFGILGRNSSGTIQCLTPDGTNCYWYPTMTACQAGATTGTPLVCGSTAMTQAWGPVSSTQNTWCNTRTDI